MSIVKSFSVGDGDTYYIKHGSDNFTMIDCNINDESIIDEILKESKTKNICRFISTHPDEDHIHGIEILDKRWGIKNFYCVNNKATKEEITPSFERYCELRDDEEKAFYLYKDCSRRWMNRNSSEADEVQRGSSGINILWPNTENKYFMEVLENVKKGESPNNISPVIVYRTGAKFMWMGDLETDFLEKVADDIEFEEIDVLFAPHHGRESGVIPQDILKKINPQIIVIGEAPSNKLHYYNNYNMITQNTAKDIIFDVSSDVVDVYVGSNTYAVSFLYNQCQSDKLGNYIGSFYPRKGRK